MARFTVRVELHGVKDEATYTRLHQAMFAAGFYRFITGDDGKQFLMPTAEYDLPASVETAAQVRERAYAIALAHQPKLIPVKTPWVLVTTGEASWRLDPLKV